MIEYIVPTRPLYGPISTTVCMLVFWLLAFVTLNCALLSTVSTGSFTPNSAAWPTNVAIAYNVGVIKGSTPNFDRKKRGKDADIRVGSVECKNVTGAMENGRVHDGRDCKVESNERGGCVEGVRMSFVLAISRGARSTPVIPAADTAMAKDVKGEGEARISRPPAYVKEGDIWKERPGSGRARRAERNDRAKEVIVDKSIE